ncbi:MULTISPECIES: GlsB/YeaQ/YmgE family stress response membrane protein [Myxococcus]|uniref:GlsB/YeaQ/YmgE family stress response membrane protein n=1 Tax=Myxococcus TaxID=32 RepID=UPI00114468ED|nr:MULTISPECIES: GlsB/YeaQ/YmgE family stress response membrane protein [Myxococcus]NOK02807.1 GlsB/YeaQ/YmgE family stress response membrane protein [Myxococcus xanthus]
MGIIAFLIIGLLAGLIARALMPGNQSMGLLATTLLGIAGSFVGGFIASLFRSDGRVFDLHPTGLLFSVLGALLVLFLVGLAGRGRRVHV